MKWINRRSYLIIHCKGKANGFIRKAYCPDMRGEFIWAWQVMWNDFQERGWEVTKAAAIKSADVVIGRLTSGVQ